MIEVWADMLDDVEYTAANAALRVLLASCKHPPTIAEIRETLVEIQHGPVRAGAEGWSDVMGEVHRVGFYRSPSFSDPITARCVAALGWQTLCSSENQVADRARFIEMYDQIAKQHRAEQKSPALLEARKEREHAAAQKLITRVAKLLTGGRDE